MTQYPPSTEFVGIREVAAFLGVHYVTVMKAVNRGDIPATKVGRQWRIHKDTLERLRGPINTSSSTPGSDRLSESSRGSGSGSGSGGGILQLTPTAFDFPDEGSAFTIGGT